MKRKFKKSCENKKTHSAFENLTHPQKVMVCSKTIDFFLFNCCWPYIYELIKETLTSFDFSSQKLIIFGSGVFAGYLFNKYREKLLSLKRVLYYIDIITNILLLIFMLIEPNYRIYFWMSQIIFSALIQMPIDLVAENIKNRVFLTGESREYYAAVKTQFCSASTFAGALISFITPNFIPEQLMLVMLAVSQFMESILFIYLDKYTEECKDKEPDRVSS